MVFRSRRYKRIRLSIHPQAGFRKVLDILEEVALPATTCKADHIKYAVLEMINNSLRAHRLVECGEPIDVAFDLRFPRLLIKVSDRGRGFDPKSLPFSLQADPGAIDLEAEPFQNYRRLNNYRRFGMGLPLVLRTFDSFKLAFVDDAGSEMPWDTWDPQHVRGTSITVSATLLATGDGRPVASGARTRA